MIRILLIALLSFTLSACTVKPTTDYRSNQDFSQYRTFAFSTPPEGSIESIDDSRIRDAVLLQLEQKGVRKVDKQDADLHVLFRIDSESELESFGSSAGFGLSRNKTSIALSTPVKYQENKYGKLVLELVDAKTQSIVWKSISQRRLQETIKVDKRTQFINTEITNMLSEYPPKNR